MKRVSKKTGFTLVELLVVIGIIALLISILLPSLNKARETANRVKCQSNLSQMGKALLLYSNENKGAFPRTKAGTGAITLSYAATGAADADPFTSTNVPLNSIPASMFLLIRTQDMTTEVFTCPSGTAEKDLMANSAATQRSNFTGDGTLVVKNVSYSFVNVFPTTTATGLGYKTFITAFSSDFAIAADISPGSQAASKMGADTNISGATVGVARSVMIRANSKNHDQDGQNVLYADGHAEFQQTALCGTQNDNIYSANSVDASGNLSTTGASTTGSDPRHAADSVLGIDMVNSVGP